MMSTGDFRTGSVSLPAADADEVPECCFTCPYLASKEFSMNPGDGLFYFFCAYHTPGRLTQAEPPCLAPGG